MPCGLLAWVLGRGARRGKTRDNGQEAVEPDIRYPPGSSQLWQNSCWQLGRMIMEPMGPSRWCFVLGSGIGLLCTCAVRRLADALPAHTAAQATVWRCLGYGAGYDAGGCKQPWSRDDSQRDERRGAGAGSWEWSGEAGKRGNPAGVEVDVQCYINVGACYISSHSNWAD